MDARVAAVSLCSVAACLRASSALLLALMASMACTRNMFQSFDSLLDGAAVHAQLRQLFADTMPQVLNHRWAPCL